MSSFHHANAFETRDADGTVSSIRVVTSGFREYEFGHEFGYTEGLVDFHPGRARPKPKTGEAGNQELWSIDIALNTNTSEGSSGGAKGGAGATLAKKTLLDSVHGMDFLSVHPDRIGEHLMLCSVLCLFVCCQGWSVPHASVLVSSDQANLFCDCTVRIANTIRVFVREYLRLWRSLQHAFACRQHIGRARCLEVSCPLFCG